MTAVNFSADGTRWRAVPVTPNMLQTAPVVPGPGLLFTSADGEIRFLPIDPDVVPDLQTLQAKTNAELGTLVKTAKVLDR